MEKIKVFLAWSGEWSQQVAASLREWLPSVIQQLDPWMSDTDIAKGTQWRTVISDQLREVKVGIICLTPENLERPWINFEAGAISKAIQDDSYVCTYLFGLSSADVTEPLAQFQSTKAEKEDTRKLLQTINRALGESGLAPDALNKAYDKWWPELEAALKRIPGRTPVSLPKKRSQEDMIEEILSIVREQSITLQNQIVKTTIAQHDPRIGRGIFPHVIHSSADPTRTAVERIVGAILDENLKNIQKEKGPNLRGEGPDQEKQS